MKNDNELAVVDSPTLGIGPEVYPSSAAGFAGSASAAKIEGFPLSLRRSGQNLPSIGHQEFPPVQINISARHGHLSPGTQEKIQEKVGGIRRFLDRITAIQVTVDLEHRDSPTLELCVDAEHHDDFVATVQADSVLAALDGAIEKIEQQLRKFKERLKEHRATSHKHLEPPAEEE